MKIFIVAAHPDDEVLGCGGSMAKWAQEGHEINVLIMAEGLTSRDQQRDRRARKKELSILEKTAKQANNILNVSSVELLNYPDNRMDSVDLLDIVKAIEQKITKLKPNLVVTHHIGDLNIDHQVTHRAVMTACRPQPGQTVRRILSFEVPSATEWQSSSSGCSFVPNWYEDISETLKLKIKALKAYESEMKPWPHARSLNAVEHLAKWRGASVGLNSAEAFMLIREIK